MELKELCRDIGLADEVTKLVLEYPGVPGPILAMLRSQDTWESGRQALAEHLGPDPDGFGTLAASLQCALGTWALYQEKGISREIFISTMGCFSRFVREHLESYGRYGFDRDFWTVRQLSAVLFRVGELEYELLETEHGRVVSLHIPSDARLENRLLRQSLEAFRAMAAQAFPEYAGAPIGCRSWLLSPTLRELLPADSRILGFQRNFDIQPLEPGQVYALWVFKNPNLAPGDYPEDTLLQRRLKAHLLSGGEFLNAQGRLRQDAFL